MRQFTPILFMVITLGLVAAAIFYLSRRFTLFFPAPGMKGWVWIFSLGLVFAFVGSIGFSELTNPFVTAWSLVGSILLGAFILLLLSLAVTDLLHLFLKPSPALRGWLTVGLTTLLTGYGVWNAYHFRVKEVTIPIRGLTGEIRAVHLTDIHLGNSRGKKELERIVRITKELSPEIIFNTGDLFDSKTHFNGDEDVLDAFQTISVPHYFVFGNHDEQVGLKQVLHRTEASGVTLLMNRMAHYKELQIVGLNNMMADSDSFDIHANSDSTTVKSVMQSMEIDPERPLIVLHHRPDGIPYMAEVGADLLLTGHTHAGQMFPFTLIAKWMFGYNKGLYKYEEMQIYVSQGLGTFFSPIRFGTQSEITLLRLVPA
ncbi:metallophosphoesterase [Dysgonomonadaceae bacterium zrk40]|nr:metallophosphoesterase [Dysgonomonadaceae bacterium zrk40]